MISDRFVDFTFEESPLEQCLAALRPGESLSAARLLTLLDGESAQELEEAVEQLWTLGAELNMADLPAYSADSESALRLRREAELVRDGRLLCDLEAADPLRLYLEELAAIPVCGDPELLAGELRAANCRDTGAEDARRRMMDLCLSRVVELAQTYTGKGVLLMDLIQEGSMGLWVDICAYTEGDFSQYRDRSIRRQMEKAILLQAHAAGVGQKLRQAAEDYRAVDERLLTELGRNPTLEEIAEAMRVTAEEAAVYANMLTMARTRQQVDAAMEHKEEEPEDQQAVEDTAYFQMRQRIMELLSTLSEEDAKLLTLRFGLEGGLPLSPEEAGKKLGLTSQEVVMKEASALAKLRQQG